MSNIDWNFLSEEIIESNIELIIMFYKKIAI